MAKAGRWDFSDAETRKRGERMGLDTPVVHAVNDADWSLKRIDPLSGEANALSLPPG